MRKPSIFNDLDPGKPGYSSFDLSHEVKTTTEFGYLTPVFWKFAIPGDHFSGSAEVLTRLLPMTFPVMHRINVHVHHFFVPLRLLTSNWERFITMSDSGGIVTQQSASHHQLPTYAYIRETEGDVLDDKDMLLDYLGVPVRNLDRGGSVTISALPIIAYLKIWWDWYRDENVQDMDWIDKKFFGGLDPMQRTAILDIFEGRPSYSNEILRLNDILKYMGKLFLRNYEKDYFTTALPWTQKGMPVTLPLGDFAPLTWDGYPNSNIAGYGYAPLYALRRRIDEGEKLVDRVVNAAGSPGTIPLLGFDAPSGGISDGEPIYSGVKYSSFEDSNLGADLRNATAANINDLREAFQVQKFLEKNARNGSRYIEFIFSHFGVVVPDYRLSRADYIGGGKSPVNISEVLSSVNTPEEPLGSYAGHGLNVGQSSPFETYVKEHGIIMSILSIVPRTSYCDGLRREFMVTGPEDFPFPVFSHLGEQPVYSNELFMEELHIERKDTFPVFGYQSRYAEYRSHIDTVTGQFRTRNTPGLQDFHLAVRYSDDVHFINGDIIQVNPQYLNHIFPVTTSEDHHFLVQMLFSITATRPLPFDAAPGLIDHF